MRRHRLPQQTTTLHAPVPCLTGPQLAGTKTNVVLFIIQGPTLGAKNLLHDDLFRQVWRLYVGLEPFTRAAVEDRRILLMGATPAVLLWGKFMFYYPPV